MRADDEPGAQRNSRPRVAVVVSHPIQHFCPQYASWARRDEFELMVLFASRHGLDAYRDENFATIVQWQGLELDFPHRFLAGAETRALHAGIDAPDLDAKLAHYRPDAVLVYGYAQPLQRRALRWAKRHTTPLLMISDAELRAARPFWKALLKRFVLPHLLAPISAFLTVGDANEDYYRYFGIDDARLIRCPFPIDVALFAGVFAERHALRARLRQDWGIPACAVVVLMVGKLVSWKRQADLIEAARQLRASGAPVNVVFAGTGPEFTGLQQRAAGLDNVHFAGFVQPRDLAAFYVASDIYVHCSEIEPHSLAVSEAIYAGLPVLISDRCGSYGPSDDVQPERNGYVYPCGDVRQLAAHIQALAEDGPLRERFGAASHEIAREAQRLAHGDGIARALASLPQRLEVRA